MSFFDDLNKGITDAVNAKVTAYKARVASRSAVSGNTGAYFGQSIVDAVGAYLTGGRDAARTKAAEKFAASGTGSAFIDEVTKQKIAAIMNDPKTWFIGVAVIAVIFMLGRAGR